MIIHIVNQFIHQRIALSRTVFHMFVPDISLPLKRPAIPRYFFSTLETDFTSSSPFPIPKQTAVFPSAAKRSRIRSAARRSLISCGVMPSIPILPKITSSFFTCKYQKQFLPGFFFPFVIQFHSIRIHSQNRKIHFFSPSYALRHGNPFR